MTPDKVYIQPAHHVLGGGTSSREERWERLVGGEHDLIVVGGGITGAGVFRRAARRGLRVVLLEQRDFAWGTSSRSGKLVHGGLRYLAQGQVRTSLHSVRERERLLRAYPGLVTPLEMVIVPPGERRAMKWALGGALAAYETMAGRRARTWHPAERASELAAGLRPLRLGAWTTVDARTDDARLVLRTLDEGRARGGLTLSYARVTGFLRDARGKVSGVQVEDTVTGRTAEVRASAVVSATGAWADRLRATLGKDRHIRPLRGSHLVFPRERLPLDRIVGLMSPTDGRGLYALPWEGRTLVGTTDLDHTPDLDDEPAASPAEVDYLLEAVNYWFPEADLGSDDAIASQAGVRPVVDTGKADPSKEARDEVVWVDPGLVTISGGKLTTFDRMAGQALRAAAPWLPGRADPPADPPLHPLDRLDARYGLRAPEVRRLPGTDATVEGLPTRWAEVRWGASEEVVHLDDLLMRRVRLGLLLPRGGEGILDRVRAEAGHSLGWSDARWGSEVARYRELWETRCAPGGVLA